MPKDTEGGGLNIKTRAKVANGIKSNCAIIPTMAGFGLRHSISKSSRLMSKAIENIIKAKITLSINKLSWLKLTFMVSIVLSIL